MKKVSALMYAFVMAALFLTSCGGDEEGDATDPTTPTVSLTAAGDVQAMGVATVKPSEYVTVVVSGLKSDKNLKQVSFYEGQNLISDASRIMINDETQSDNPVDVIRQDNDAFTWTVKIMASSAEESNDYRIVLEDNDGLMSEVMFTIITSNTDMNDEVKLYSSLAQVSEATTIGSFYAVASNMTGTSTMFADQFKEADADFGFDEDAQGNYSITSPGMITSKDGFTTTTNFGTSSINFATATYADLNGLTPDGGSVSISEGGTYSFRNSTTGARGLINVTSIDATTDLMTFDVKFITVNEVVIIKR